MTTDDSGSHDIRTPHHPLDHAQDATSIAASAVMTGFTIASELMGGLRAAASPGTAANQRARRGAAGHGDQNLRTHLQGHGVDLLGSAFDVMRLGMNMLEDAAGFFLGAQTGAPAAASDSARAAPAALQIRGLQRGSSGTAGMEIENRTAEPIQGLQLQPPVLHSRTNQLDPGSVRFDPERLDLEPGGCVPVTVTVSVPGDAEPGWYSGVIVAWPLHDADTILKVEVTDVLGGIPIPVRNVPR